MKILIDMNLSPRWVDFLRQNGFEAIHWSEVGLTNAPDMEIMDYAAVNGYVILTHDLDFGTMLAKTGVKIPSVIQVRAADITPRTTAFPVVCLLRQYEHEIEDGVLVTINENRTRIRILPIDSRFSGS
jgi:predicted nuclease of predicted toxin-antitoxin system